jgi:hypothetical protein
MVSRSDPAVVTKKRSRKAHASIESQMADRQHSETVSPQAHSVVRSEDMHEDEGIVKQFRIFGR